MPKYTYKCSHCSDTMDIYHSFSDTYDVCDHCGATGCLERLPSDFTLVKNTKEQKAGDIVKRSIHEFGEELKAQKEKLKKELYEPNK